MPSAMRALKTPAAKAAQSMTLAVGATVACSTVASTTPATLPGRPTICAA